MNRLRRQDSISDNLRAAPLRARRAVQTLFARPNPAPIFILGHQKSGTSAVASLLSELTGRSVTIDLRNEDRWPSYPRVTGGAKTFQWFVRRNRLDFSREIVKEPNLTFFYPQLAAHFPRARFVMVMRDPRTNVKSILDRLGLPGNLEEIPPGDSRRLRHGWKLMFDPAWLDLKSGNYVELLAQRWNLCADAYLEQPEAMRLVRYEDFRAAKLETLEALASDLHLECRHDIRARLDTQFQPAGDRRMPVDRFFGPDNLDRLEAVCRPRMQPFGYPQSIAAQPLD